MAETIGFIGIGDMGRPMSANLVKAGFTVAAYDVDPSRAAQPGLRAATSIEDACAGASVVISLVRTLPQTEAVVAALERAMSPGTVLLVMSTLNPSAVARIAERMRARQVDVLDAPVSGGTAGAEAGTLAIMAAGRAPVLERVRPMLDALGTNVVHVGEQPGHGQAVKLANQLMLAANMLGTFEAMKLAESYGVTEQQVLPVIGASTGMSWVSAHWDTVRGWWEGHPSGGALDIIYKDLRSLLGDAAEHQLSYPVTALAFNLLLEVW
jgi:3-hydroxyisobutyrate dehydrogenase-like beta-hydroxyacid dehydrogenase